MRKSRASETSKPTPKANPRFATITGLAQRAGAAMFQASFETVSGVACMKPLMLPPEEECSPTARSTITRARAVMRVERHEHQAKLAALRHRHDVEGRPVEDHVGALACFVDLDAESVECRKARIDEGHRSHAAVPRCGGICSTSYSPATSLRRNSLPTGGFGMA